MNNASQATNSNATATDAQSAATQSAAPAKAFFDEEFKTAAGRAFKLGIYATIIAAPVMALSVVAARLNNSGNA